MHNQGLVVVLTLGLATGLLLLVGASSVEEPLPEARHLLHLVEAIQANKRPSAKEVVDAYEEYVHLYELQTELASSFNPDRSQQGSVKSENKYQRIGKVLSKEGLDTIADSLFGSFDATEPGQRIVMTQKLRKNIEGAINELMGTK